MISDNIRDKMIDVYKNLNRVRAESTGNKNSGSIGVVFIDDTLSTGAVKSSGAVTFNSMPASETVQKIVVTKSGPSYYRRTLGETETEPDNWYENIESLLSASDPIGQIGSLGAPKGSGNTAVQNVGYMPTPVYMPNLNKSLNMTINDNNRTYAGGSDTTTPYTLLTRVLKTEQELDYLHNLQVLLWNNSEEQGNYAGAILCPAYSFTSTVGDFNSNNFRVEYDVSNLGLTYSEALNGRLVIESIESKVINS